MAPDVSPMGSSDLSSRSAMDSSTMASESSKSPLNGDATDERCEDPRCESSGGPVWHCIDCDSNFCSVCWPLQGPHRAGKRGRDGLPHEKTDLQVEAHDKDTVSKWFGVTKDLAGRPRFEDYGRYATLMSSFASTSNRTNKYPQLVSFIGVTNSGKSAIIKMLISRAVAARKSTDSDLSWPSPVVGSILHDTEPTSGDVNLYADPLTYADSLPLLFADCEGFEGGERTPLGAIARRTADGTTRRDRVRLASSNSRVIEWANTDETRQREFAVSELYPRLLYTFSDVVVFVLRNPKTFQSAVLNKLLDWGVAALEKSINQPALPHAIVVLNATDAAVDEREWNTDFATQSLLSCVEGALDYVEGVPKLRKLAEHWKALGKSIHTVEDLILRYYSSFQVLRVPTKPRYMMMDSQIGKLQTIIEDKCRKSFQAKRRARMLTNADELNTYFQAGFNHFITNLDIPFNFVEVSLRTNPIPYDFGGHILQLATSAAALYPREEARAAWMFEKLSVMLASCVMLDCARFRKGRMEDLFGNYEQFFDWALQEFFELHWTCSFTIQGRRCELVRARHEVKGHQDIMGIIAAGEYQSRVTTDVFISRFKEQLKSAIASIQRDFHYEAEQVNQGDEHVPDETIALSLHKEYISQFFAAVGPADQLFSHASCFSCLMSVPEHPLPCGHVICHACLQAFGKSTGRSTITLSACPLHVDVTRWTKPLQIHVKPQGAGVRVLCLDGGGIRGMVQLEVLREIEQVLGNHFPIQCFFDLVCGTGTGGVIATALGVQKKPIFPEIFDMFSALCDISYAPRVRGLPLLRLAAFLGGGSQYKTGPLRRALQMAFGSEDLLFGGPSQSRRKHQLKVAVTTTTATTRSISVLANHRRPEDHAPFYDFERPHDLSFEMKIWQALAATTASPNYFKPFINEQTHRSYVDGAARFVNPAIIADRERRLIWPDVAHKDPDIFLSVGTGQNRIQILSRFADFKKSQLLQQQHKKSTSKNRGWIRQAANILSNRGADILEAEIEWASFRDSLAHQEGTAGRRYIRFNPDLDQDPPAIDARSEVRSLQQTTRKRLWLPHRQSALQHVGHRLIASSFYFEVRSRKLGSSKGCKGVIACRFEDGSDEIKAMGKFLQSKQTSTFEPHFLIKSCEQDDRGDKLSITSRMFHDMTQYSKLEFDEIEIPIKDEMEQTSITLFLSEHDGLEPGGFPISGFPQTLLVEHPLRNRGDSTSTRSTMPQPASQVRKVLSDRSISAGRSSEDIISLNRVRTRTLEPETRDSDPQTDANNSSPPPSLANILAQQTGIGSPGSRMTNRFWTYIGPQHMIRHPELYSREELRKFAPDLAVDMASELSASNDPSSTSDETECFELQATSFDPAELDATVAEGASPPGYGTAPRNAVDVSARYMAELQVHEQQQGGMSVEIPPALPPRTRGFEPSDLEAALVESEAASEYSAQEEVLRSYWAGRGNAVSV